MEVRSARSFGSSSQSLCSGFLEANPGGGGSSACNRTKSQTCKTDRAADTTRPMLPTAAAHWHFGIAVEGSAACPGLDAELPLSGLIKVRAQGLSAPV